ncbi:RHS repeat protein [Verminephrobacter aporrectodeae subsp. tuberculatae]|uniref:RHS repeat-associated core domain-containing protein n=1 Tax=Verminephrobacter aporrectodeae TaxID=1110389 RepID=UPI002238967E|nr:RHS repeat-associated core domain-containing protein [Verminephrobacter aporrectodeae]MCW5221558.1 RHS repeat protein [Verminephrobacter aporrectodeae subsp. tuberculatae]MCW5290849.1 RHS repeat protein [Verminephrobacter aporrectodeae subsp. tuberculatae]
MQLNNTQAKKMQETLLTWIEALKRSSRAVLLVLATAVLLPAQAQSMAAAQVTLPNGYLNLRSNDLVVSSAMGPMRWTQEWDGHEWRFNPQWESLSQNWKNLTGSSSASAGIGATTSTGDSGCWVWVDDDWQPSLQMTVGGGVVMVDGVAQANPMVAKRSTPFNRKISDGSSADYPAPQRVSLDYAALCPGTKAQFVDTEAIRLGNQLFMGDAGRYTFDNRSVLEKRPIQQLPAASTTASHTREDSTRTPPAPPAPESTAKGFRWSKRNGDWMDYDAQGQGVAFGDRNGNTIWLQRDAQGRLLSTVDDSGHTLLSFHYTGELLTEVKDYPLATVAGDLPSRSIKYQYDEKNRLTQITDPRGNTIQYAYDAANRLIRITDQEGRTERIVYEGDTIKQRIAPDGGVTDYEFDYDDVNKQFISKITGPETAAGRRVQDYTHNRQGQLVRYTVNGRTETEIRYDTGYRAETRTNARGFATKTTKNEFEQIVETQYPDGSKQKTVYSALHMGITEEIDELGVKTKYEYDAKGNLLKTVQAAGTAEERTTEYQVNARGQTIRVTRKGRTESNGSVTPDAIWQLAYDAQGKTSQIIDPEGNTRSYVFNRMGALVKYTDPLGNATTYETDATGNLTKITNPLGHVRTFRYDKSGNQLSSIDAKGKATLMAYDRMNRRVQTTNPVGGEYKWRYDAQGLVIGETDEDGRAISAEYDLFQHLIRASDTLGNITSYSDQIADGSATGQLGSLLDPTEVRYPSFTQQMRYDASERPTSETLVYTNSSGTQTVTRSRKTYDARGQLKSETDANGKVRSYAYDAFGQTVESVDALGGKAQARYDARGNLIEAKDAEGNTTGFTYDLNDRLTSETLAEGQVTHYSYDGAGRLTERIDPAGTKKRYSYDAASRVTQIQQIRDTTVVRTVSQTWDAENNLTAWSDTDPTRPTGQQTTSAVLTYDDAGRKTSETLSYPNPAGGSYSLAYAYQYSQAGEKTKLTWADGTEISYGYSAHGELESISIPGEGSISVNQFKWIVPAKLTLPGGSTQEKTWDGLFSLEALKSRTPGQQITLNLVNGYGKQGEMKTANRTDTANGISNARASSYDYDDELRLTRVVTDTGGLFGRDTETFGLDGLANRITHSRTGNGAWKYDKNHRLLQRPGGIGTVSYAYDANGNQTQKTEGTTTTRYHYDSDNRLIEVKNGDGNTISRYGYDPMNRRIWKEQYRDKAGQPLIPALRTYFLYADEGMVAEATQAIAIDANQQISASQAPEITTQYGLKPDSAFMTGVLFVKTKNGHGDDVFAYYHVDHLGAPLQATDKAGNVLWAANYNAFGRADIMTPRAADGNFRINSWPRLPGQYEDVETGLYYNFHRYYDPDTGRYIQSDPIGLAGGWSRFAYVNGSPLIYIDPYGLFGLADMPTAPDWVVNGVAGFGDTYSFRIAYVVRYVMDTNGSVDRCSNAYSNGKWSALGMSVFFGGAHLGRNAVNQMGQGGLGRGIGRLFSDERRWNSVRDTWSTAAGNGERWLAKNNVSLHHWLYPQRSKPIHAGYNYMPISAELNSWMNGSTVSRIIVEYGFTGIVISIYGGPILDAMIGDDCTCEK